MPRFPQFLLLLLAFQARADLFVGGFNNDAVHRYDGLPDVTSFSNKTAAKFDAARSASLNGLSASGEGIGRSNSLTVAIPEPGVLVALISGAAILLSRRRR